LLDIESIKKRFLALNKERLDRTRETLRNRQRDVMDLLPLLFHINNASFPGYVSNETPAGISEYSPTKSSIEAGQKIVRGFAFNRKALPRYDIHALFLMGSCGSIAYNAHSDLDIWLCHRPGIAADQLKLLQQKATAIESWAEEFGLEVHFFLMDAEKFKHGENVELSSESSGSAQHHLLLEEFYRTSLLFAGRYPLWWLVPPDEESNYENYTKNLLKRRFIRDSEVIDFGGMPSGLEHEFFGAALWQLYKSVDSPYKAALKLLLMETYASEHPNANLLCMVFKQAIYEGERSLEVLDPYIMLYRKIEAHLVALQDDKRLSLIQRCFYFKVEQRLGERDAANNDSWQRETMKSLSRDWGWDMGYTSLLDYRDEWKIDRVIEERKILVDALTQSYQFLSDFARKSTKLSDINQEDLHVLGRKLYAAFERKTGKIEIVNRGISKNIWESNITICQARTDQQVGWNLYQGNVFAEDIPNTKPLKRSRTIIDLITWCFINKLINQQTMIALYTMDSTLQSNDIKAIQRGLGQMFPDAQLIPTRMDDLIKAPRITKGSLFVNIGIEPSKHRLSMGMTLTSDKTDALSYSGVEDNLVLSIDQVIQNTWQEVMAYRYEGEKGILDCLGAYMQVSPPSQGIAPPQVTCHCFTTGRGMTIADRIHELFNDVVNCFYNNNMPDTTRYVVKIGKNFHVIIFEQDIFNHRNIGSYSKLLRYLSDSHNHFAPVVIDRHAMPKTPLPVIYRNNRADSIQVFYATEGRNIDVYVVDEKGSLFFQKIKNTEESIFLNQYSCFLGSVIQKQQIHLMSPAKDAEPAADNGLSFYQMIRNKKGEIRLIPQECSAADNSHNYFNLHVVADIVEGGQTVFTLYCNDKEYSSLEYGEGIYQQVVRDVLSHRQSGSTYPVHITDIEFSRPQLGKNSTAYLQTIYFLMYKRSIEENLNQAMTSSSGNQAQA